MIDLNFIENGINGQETARRINDNNSNINRALDNLQNQINNLSYSASSSSSSSSEEAGVVIYANPDSIIRQVSTIAQTIIIPITVYCGSAQLNYNGIDNGTDSFNFSTLESENTEVASYISITGVNNNSQLNINAVVSANYEGSFSYTIGIIFKGTTYRKAISFTLYNTNGEDALSIDLSPSSVILTESVSDKTINLTNACCSYTVMYGSTDVTNNVIVSGLNGLNCTGSVSNGKISINSISEVTGSGEGIEYYEWTDIDGTQHNQYKVVSGYYPCYFRYTSSDGTTYGVIKNFSFAINRIGTFKEEIIGDVHTQVSQKVINELNESGLTYTQAARTEILQSAQQIALSAVSETMSGSVQTSLSVMSDRIIALTQDVNTNKSSIEVNASNISTLITDVSGNTSSITQNANEISLITSGLTKTGIVINSESGGTITLQADRTLVKNSSGGTIAMFTEDGGLSTDVLNASYIKADEIDLGDGTYGCKLTNNGYLSARTASFTDVTVQGKLSSPFGDSQTAITSTDNLNIAGTEDSVWHDNDGLLNWNMADAGRKITFCMYKYDEGDVGYGTRNITAPTGYCFFEDGVSKNKLTLSREIIELIGLSTNQTFLGYAVLKRNDIMTQRKYGHNLKCLAMGTVTYNSSTTTPSINYTSFNGDTITVSAVVNSYGLTTLTWPSDWIYTNNYACVMITPISSYSGSNLVPVNASIYDKSYNHCGVSTVKSTDNSLVNASYQFMIYNMSDWSTLNDHTF